MWDLKNSLTSITRWVSFPRNGIPPPCWFVAASFSLRPVRGKAQDRMPAQRSEEHTSELQSLKHLVCRLFFNDTATTEIYTFPYTTLFRSVSHRRVGSWRRAFHCVR